MPNEDGNYTPEEWKGLLGDKQNEVKARQQAQADLAATKKDIDSLTHKIKEMEAAKKDTGDPEDVVTVAMLRKEREELKKELLDLHTKGETEKTQAQKDKLFEKSLKKAKEKYTEEKAGKGLSFDEVSEGTSRMVKENKVYGELIFNDPDPAERAYQVGLLDPVIAKRYETYKKTLPAEGVTSKEGLKGTTVPGNYYSQEYVKKMSEAQIKEHYPEIQESMKKWNK